ncbi:DUF1834 family protein [Sphingobium sp. WTD-1]|uniref:phage protein Gp37 n=1 Tax=Sphingobium sp. WTD-1 TaxID=2979467 RepID=UPI0024DEDB17|nr:phage protein Gp37 [Sphingobium sp. WTD-1]WIA55477.1 DUF1834 family protein [Sphingobium sp. WTD-1]WIA56586.1 DUF1834 family protein [Sphingobium sp. WTD-1]
MIAAIELAVLARLKAMQDALGFAWNRLDTLPDDWEAYLAAKRGEIKGPAAWVGFTGWSDPESWGDGVIAVTGTFGLVVVHSSARPDEAANRHGGPNPAKEPGSYRLALGAAALLDRQMLGLDLVAPMTVGDCQPLKRSKAMQDLNLSGHAMMLGCRFTIQLAGDDSDEELAALHVNWDVPAFGTPHPVDADPIVPGAQLPDDPHADATDHIALQETDPS